MAKYVIRLDYYGDVDPWWVLTYNPNASVSKTHLTRHKISAARFEANSNATLEVLDQIVKRISKYASLEKVSK